MLDPAFYRAFYPEEAETSDAALSAAAGEGRLPPDRLLNPAEFLQQVRAQGILPAGFDPMGYRLANPDVPNLDADWQAVLHFLRSGRTAGRGWDRPFDSGFYADLYLDGQGSLSTTALHDHWRAHRSRYGTLREAVLRNGFATDAWIPHFDVQAYMVLNTLTERLRTPTQGIVHFAEHGWRAMLPMSSSAYFEPEFYADLAGHAIGLPAPELYRRWVELGLPRGAAANEAEQMRQLGLDLARYPEGFDWRIYLAERPGIAPQDRTRWGALTHLADRGALERQPLPVEPAALPELLLAVADRLVSTGRQKEAERVYGRLLLLPHLEPRALQHAADQALRQERHGEALAAYRRVREAGAPQFWTYANAARCGLELGDHAEAEAWLMDGLAAYPRSERLRSLHHDLQRLRFDVAVARHVSLTGEGETETGLDAALDHMVESYLAAHRAQHGEQRPPRGETPGAPLRVAFLANQDLPQCTFYRVLQKAEQLADRGVHLVTVDRSNPADFLSALATADLAMLYRVASDPDVLRCLAACRALGVPTVYDIDDLVFDAEHFPDPLDAYAGTISAEQHAGLRAGVALVRHALRQCDAAVASTEHLAVRLRAEVRTGQVVVHRNGLSRALEALARRAEPRAPGGGVTVFYGSGTKAHGADFRVLAEPALLRLMGERPDVRFLACGYVDVSALASRFPGRVEHVPLQTDRDAYLSLLMGADINLAVLAATPFNDCKSEIKWLEAAAFCVPSLVSDVGGMREALRPGEDVVVCPAPHPDAWYLALRRLVLDPAERGRIGRAARDRALALFAPGPSGKALEASLRLLRGSSASAAPEGMPETRPATARKPRVLVANVYFPPQAIGGATRVVRDQVAGLLDGFGDRFEVGVLCGNEERVAPYRLEAYRWRGIPVWSVATPHREHMDWRHHDGAVAPLVGQVLEHFRPDLVHLHCIQRLTLAAVDEVRARGIPYLVTAHDAWWVSDHQFLMDALCRPRMPWDPEQHGTPANPHSRAASGVRKMALRAALDGATEVLAVSESFAQIYRRAGVTRIRALPNGLPELPPLEPTPPTPGKVRVGHLGGAVHHKGYFLLKQALMQGRYDRIEVVATDHSLQPGDVRHERWGASDALILGRTGQDRVGWLYGQFDVLAALSLWPESFGLVAREALAYGRWVIASERGAMAEDVAPGRNGWVVDVSGPDALRGVLEELQEEPTRFTQPPAMGPRLRRTADMVRDVADAWTNVLGLPTGSGSGRTASILPIRAEDQAGPPKRYGRRRLSA